MIEIFPYQRTPNFVFVIDGGATTLVTTDDPVFDNGRWFRTYRLSDGTTIVVRVIADGGPNNGWTEVDSGERRFDVPASNYHSDPIVLHMVKPIVDDT